MRLREYRFLVKFKGEYIKDDGNAMCFEKEDGTIVKINCEDICVIEEKEIKAWCEKNNVPVQSDIFGDDYFLWEDVAKALWEELKIVKHDQ